MKFSPYSFSKASTFYQCPYKFKLKYIDKIKIPFETNIALEKGKYIHSLIEHDIKNEKLKDFKFEIASEKDVQNFNQIFNNLQINPLYNYFKSKNGFTELGFSLKIQDKKIIPGKYDSDSLIRGYIDYLFIEDNKAIIIDWKTGKYKEDINEMQVIIYSVWAFLNFNIDIVETYFFFVEHSKYVKKTFKKEQLNELLKKILLYLRKIEKCNNFDKNISPLCNYCEFKKFGYCDGKENFDKFNVNL